MPKGAGVRAAASAPAGIFGEGRVPGMTVIIIVIQHPVLGTLNVVIVAALDRPEEEQPGTKAEGEGQDDQKGQGPHGRTNLLPRSAVRSSRKNGSNGLPGTSIGADAVFEDRLFSPRADDELDIPQSPARKVYHARVSPLSVSGKRVLLVIAAR
jgi:hypothetical protein